MTDRPRCTPRDRPGETASIALPVMAGAGASVAAHRVRRSRTSRWRAASLVAVHLLILGHIAHWLITGRTLSPVEPSEAMYALNDGHINAGLIFFGAAIVATLVFGRFVCGWGCHVIAYQDLCAWLLKKVGIKPKPFRSRLLVFAPLALALYMFVWPSVYRLCVGAPFPSPTNHLLKADFWETFPGPVVAVLTILTCGFAIVYFLGSKGFCTYACPYGGFFRLADKVALGRILVTDACEHCGHCTATCTSNVRVHEEVAQFGMVVDPGCMKCMDCVSVCPNHALYFGFGGTTRTADPVPFGKPTPYDFAWWEELVTAAVGVGALLAFRGLYGQIPLLMAMAMAAMTGYVFVKSVHLVVSANVRLQNLSLKRGRRLTRAGAVFAAAAAGLGVFTLHSAVVRYSVWQGHRLVNAAAIGDEVWAPAAPGADWWGRASVGQREIVDAATGFLHRADRWGLMETPQVRTDLAWLYLARGRDDEAEAILRRMVADAPDEPYRHRGLAGVLRKTGRVDEAERSYREALRIDPEYAPARSECAAMLASAGRIDEAVALYRDAMAESSSQSQWRLAAARLLIDAGRFAEAREVIPPPGVSQPDTAPGFTLSGIAAMRLGQRAEAMQLFRTALSLEPGHSDAHYNLAMALLDERKIEEAVSHLQAAVTSNPRFALAQYNLAVARFMAGRPADALGPIREAIRLEPDNADAYGFLSVVLRELGDVEGSAAAAREAEGRRTTPGGR